MVDFKFDWSAYLIVNFFDIKLHGYPYYSVKYPSYLNVCTYIYIIFCIKLVIYQVGHLNCWLSL